MITTGALIAAALTGSVLTLLVLQLQIEWNNRRSQRDLRAARRDAQWTHIAEAHAAADAARRQLTAMPPLRAEPDFSDLHAGDLPWSERRRLPSTRQRYDRLRALRSGPGQHRAIGGAA